MRKTRKIHADFLTVVNCFLRIDGEKKILLESVPRDKENARYSILAWNPVSEVRFEEGQLFFNKDKRPSKDPLKELENLVLSDKKDHGELPFQAGAIGYVAYDLIRFYENIGPAQKDEINVPDMLFYLYDSYLVFDHNQEVIHLVEDSIYSHREEKELEEALQSVNEQLLTPSKKELLQEEFEPLKYTSNFSKEAFEAIVTKTQALIKEGDMFQMVPSQRLTADFPHQAFSYYRKLRQKNPSSYLYYMDMGDFQILGSSPESLVSLKGEIVQTNPIAGTRKRGKTEIEDNQLAYDLMHDEKEIAEHKMLIDLGRNDIGKISEAGSVTIPLMMRVERYRYVMHIVSVVQGRIKKGFTAMDALKATLPAGTVSGAPKIRAMERITQFEPVKRGIYSGAIGYLSHEGNCDFAIAIRTMVVKNQKAYMQAGAGIVYDSVPESEYFETLNKARALTEL